MAAPAAKRAGFGLPELAVTLGCLGLLVAFLLPQLAGQRELSRRQSCQDNLRKIGLAMSSYHDRHQSFPPGYFPSDYARDDEGTPRWASKIPSFAWSAFLLFDLGHVGLHERLALDNANMPELIADTRRWVHLSSSLGGFRCPSDLTGPTMSSAPLPANAKSLDHTMPGVVGGASSYVANAGYFELQHPLFGPTPRNWPEQVRARTTGNNGIFFPGSTLHRRQIVDGLSQTILVGERAWYQGSATWTGTQDVRGTSVGAGGASLGRVWWPINAMPLIDGRKADRWYSRRLVTKVNGVVVPKPHSSRNAFGSYHLDGAHFLMADGSVSFLDSQIDFNNTIERVGADPTSPVPEVGELGLFQRLGIRNDSASLTDNAGLEESP